MENTDKILNTFWL